ncbi:Retrovirus-related Pol polyprotein from transposon TNT 1-94 [Apostasia shenzhenica]|uniref:Retrovirus-related Pol polyprotein from transposon TNT 1-94 n=1 Tax=Apostasia shenzhenica TaxID=1088818 RepID=A0A2I0AUG3_9ASPA|nr:Retrovirus-related Pol polyprotein from transposon TNT 1-94 [Apostasia shenzhenica]
MDRQALGMIRLTLARNMAFNIVNEKTTSGLMKALCNMYEKPSASKKVYLMHRLFNLKRAIAEFYCWKVRKGLPLEIAEKGDVQIRTWNGSIWRLHDVRYIPGLKRNLISIGQLDSIRYITIFENSSWRIVKGAMVVAKVKDSVKWESAMQDEFDSLMKNRTWELAPLPDGKKALQNKWIYRIKEEADGNKKYKARLVVKGFQQKACIDYTENFHLLLK